MSKSQTAISERTRKTCGSDLVWTGADFRFDFDSEYQVALLFSG